MVFLFATYILSNIFFEMILENRLNPFFEKNISIKNFNIKSGVTSFDIFIDNRRAVEFFGEFDLIELSGEFEYRIFNGNWNWFKKDIVDTDGFSASGKINFSPETIGISGDVKNDKERGIFKYKNVDEKISFELFTQNFSTKKLGQIFDYKLFGKTIDTNLTLFGTAHNLESDLVGIVIDEVALEGKLKHVNKKLNFNGKTSFFNSKVEVSISEQSHVVTLKEFQIGSLSKELFKEQLFYGSGNLEISEKANKFYIFRGYVDVLAVEKNKILSFINEIWGLDFFKQPLKNIRFNGELKGNTLIFHLKGSGVKYSYTIENGNYDFFHKVGVIPVSVGDEDFFGRFVIDLKDKSVKTELSRLGYEVLQEHLENSNQELKNIVEILEL
jgi:hypothetical protein